MTNPTPGFYIDTGAADPNHLAIDVTGYGSVYISTSADGLSVDIYPFHVVDSPIASCWASMGDLAQPEREEDR